MKNLITFFILFSSLSTYVFFLFNRNYPLSIISIALGFIIWLISMGIYKRKISGLHFILILFGMLVSLAFFIGYGLDLDHPCCIHENMININTELFKEKMIENVAKNN